MRRRSLAAGVLILVLSLLLSCSPVPQQAQRAEPQPAVNKAPHSVVSSGEKALKEEARVPPATPPPPVYSFEIRNSYPHDHAAFTQGLVIQDGVLFESTGLHGSSSLRKVDLQTGRVLKKIDVPAEYFAEGMTIFRGKIFQLTWQSHKGFTYNPESFAKTGEFAYEGEGWGLTHDEHSLIMSDGTNRIRFLDPSSFKVVRTIKVFDGTLPLTQLNELEYIRGEIYANIWQTDRVVRIAPGTGEVIGWIDLTGLLKIKDDPAEPVNVLNGIAYDERKDRLYVTGKLWPKLFEIKLKPKKQ
jgi:glutaminyl-peptide cyclotransferase